MPPITVPDVVSVLVSLLALAGVVFTIISNRRKTAAEADNYDANAGSQIAASSLSLIQPMQKRISELETLTADQGARLTMQAQRITTMETESVVRSAEVEGLRDGVKVLTNQLKRLNIVPEYTPNPPPAIKPVTGPLGKGV